VKDNEDNKKNRILNGRSREDGTGLGRREGNE
jgi:hypothetical protein